jgi:hypothetical protein
MQFSWIKRLTPSQTQRYEQKMLRALPQVSHRNIGSN